jgi:hypothetical protein
MAKHAVLSASGASRWIGCPGSVRLCAELPARLKNRTSVYADEGTAAHSVGEQCLRDGSFLPEDFRDRLIPAELKEWPCNDDMIEAVTIYVEYVRRRQREMGANLFVEARVRPLPERDDMYGTADAVLVEPYGEIEVIDYKHGAGVFVSEVDNDQMKFYGLGAVANVGPLNISGGKITIVQPRCEGMEPVRPWDVSVDDLLNFGDTMRAARIETEKPDAPLIPGDHCRWCPAAALCPALNAQAELAVVDDFADVIAEHAALDAVPEPEVTVTLPDPNDPDALYLALCMLPALDHFKKRVNEMAEDNLEHNIPVRGHKLVRKRANRAWVDPVALEERLRKKKGVKVGDFTTRALKSPAQMEKIPGIGKTFVADHCHNPKGGLALVRAEDPRPEVDLLDEFADALDWTQD